MSGFVTRKMRSFKSRSPIGDSPALDPWREFREIEVIGMPLSFQFNHSLGKLSRFFLELENRRLMGTRCPQCGRLWIPPRVMCPDDWAIGCWEEVSSRGVLEIAARSFHAKPDGSGPLDRVLGYVRLDGAHTSILQRIANYGDARRLVRGMPLKVVWAEDEVSHPMELFWFEPIE